ncbi:MAG: hypothetical protein V4546_05030 [Bacteroidota bacterium]
MKRNYSHINTLEDLHNEVHRLKVDYKRRGVLIKEDSKHYIKRFSIGNMFRKHATPNGLLKLDENTHITSKIMSIALPMLLNSTVFRGSGVITKAIGALVSGKLGKSLDAENLTGAFNMVKSLFGKKTKKKQVGFVDYGIPPDSETY